MEGLINRDLLDVRTAAHEWIVPDGHDFLVLPDGYVVSFTHFHDHGFADLAHCFLLGLLHHYKIKMQHLNPNGIQHIAAFIALCEGYLGIDLWWYFFSIDLHTRREHDRLEVTMPMGCAEIRL
jgi:hypothetical protein